MMQRFAEVSAALCLAAATALPAGADVPFGVAQLEVLPGWREADGTHFAGLHITLAPGWKTYWRSPGDGGIPPRMALSSSGNLESASVYWPVPSVFYAYGLRSIGYENEVVLPVAFRAVDGEAPIRLSGQIEIGVCEDICIPMQFDVDALLPPAGLDDPVIRAALADRPMTAQEAGVREVSCAVGANADGLEVTARVVMPALTASETAVLELGGQNVWISEADTTRDGATLTAVVDMVGETGAPFVLDRSAVRITIIGDGEAVDIRGCG